jgi:sugar lactone lactonase YvrE
VNKPINRQSKGAPDNVLLIGTDGGVSRFNGNTWPPKTLDGPSPRSHYVKSIAIAPDGALWFGTRDNGAFRFDGKKWTTYTIQDGLAGKGVNSIAVAHDGVLWFACSTLWGSRERGVSRFDGRTWSTITEDDGLANDFVNSITVAPDGALWFTTSDGASRFDGESWRTYTTHDGLVSNSIRAISITPNGVLWFGTSNGVSRFDGETWTTYTAQDGLAKNSITSIAISRDEVLWFGTSSGVSRFDGETWTTYTSANSGLIDDSVKVLAVDGQNRVWMGTRKGLSVLDEHIAQPARPFHPLAAVWLVVRVVLGIAALVLLPVIRIARQNIALRILRVGFIMSLIISVGYVIGTGQVMLLTIFVPITFGLLVSLIVSSVVYKVKRELTATTAWIVFVVAVAASFVWVVSQGGFAF